MLEETDEEEQEEAGQILLGNFHPYPPPTPQPPPRYLCSVAGPWHFCTDPDPRIRASA